MEASKETLRTPTQCSQCMARLQVVLVLEVAKVVALDELVKPATRRRRQLCVPVLHSLGGGILGITS